MRLWHKDLIRYLPKEQLVLQWFTCIAIAGTIYKNGTPDDSLVNYISDYPIEHFVYYSMCVRAEMIRRGYETAKEVSDKIWCLLPDPNVKKIDIEFEDLFKNHHDEIYFEICLWNLYEKQIRGILSKNKLPFDYLIK